jgi:hypothetical protein
LERDRAALEAEEARIQASSRSMPLRHSGAWQTASTLLPSGSRTKAP